MTVVSELVSSPRTSARAATHMNTPHVLTGYFARLRSHIILPIIRAVVGEQIVVVSYAIGVLVRRALLLVARAVGRALVISPVLITTENRRLPTI